MSKLAILLGNRAMTNGKTMSLVDLGMDQWLQDNAASLCGADYAVARVIGVDRGQFTIRSESGESFAKLTGKFSYDVESAEDIPCVGDWVCVEFHDMESPETIHSVFPRKTFLRRKIAGENIEFQMIAANIDTAFIVQSCHFDFNINRLERYLVMVNDGYIEPVILLTKTDLITPDELNERLEQIKNAGIFNDVIALSSVTGSGVDEVQAMMEPRKTYCLLGSSGVGKTTLINRLQSNDELETQTVSGTGEGRHTTTRRSLQMLEQGAMLIDMPGMRELGIMSAAKGMEDSFSDIVELEEQCRFSDCGHTNEPGCAILEALDSETLNAEHYENYLKLKKESEFNEMSYADKRKKDKDFSKLITATMKGKKH